MDHHTNEDYTMETPASCEVDRLPAELLVNVVSLLTSPIDACSVAAVSRAFRAAADSDAVWSNFLPRNLPQFAKGELPRKPMSNKELFGRLCSQAALFPHKIISMQLDRATGTERLTLSSRALQIPPGDRLRRRGPVNSVSRYSKRDRRALFSEVAWFFPINRLEIQVNIQRKILSRNATYRVCMLFKLPPRYLRHEFVFLEASIGLAGKESSRQVCLPDNVKEDECSCLSISGHVIPPLGESAYFPCKKTDSWMEVELGEFRNMEGDGGDEVSIILTETTPRRLSGLIVWAIELRSTPSVQD